MILTSTVTLTFADLHDSTVQYIPFVRPYRSRGQNPQLSSSLVPGLSQELKTCGDPSPFTPPTERLRSSQGIVSPLSSQWLLPATQPMEFERKRLLDASVSRPRLLRLGKTITAKHGNECPRSLVPVDSSKRIQCHLLCCVVDLSTVYEQSLPFAKKSRLSCSSTCTVVQ